MALLQLSSDNPHFSFIIAKNPNTGLIARHLRLGTLFGYYANESTYAAYFKDAPNEVSYKSYKDESFEYMNTTRYNTAFFPIDVISEFFSSTLKANTGSLKEHDTAGFDNQIEFNLVRFDNKKYIEIFSKYLNDFKIEATEKAAKNYNIKIKTNRTISELINCTALFMVFNILKNAKDYIEINEDQLIKYLACLGRLDVPYFMKYVFKVNLVRSPRLFKQRKELLEKSDTEKIEMEFGSTTEQRMKAILDSLTFLHPVCEIGCAEGQQTLQIAKKLHKTGLPIYAIDVDPICRDKVTHRAGKRNLNNVTVLESFNKFKELNISEKSEVLMIEVIEHLKFNEATALFREVLKYCKTKATRLIITTPNYEFNQFYAIESFRHDDHKFEFREIDFKGWVDTTAKGIKEENIRYFTVGDKVNDIPTTLGVMILFDEGTEA